MINKLIKSIKEKTIFLKIKRKINSIFSIYYLKNKNLIFQQEIDYTYRKLKDKYKDIIENGVENSFESKESNKVWICWLQGEKEAPKLVQACIESIRKNLTNKEVVILNKENLYNYIDLPNYILEKYNNGIISNTHFSDLIRIELLCTYGGMWVDATVLATGNFSDLYNIPLFVYKQLDLTRLGNNPIVASSWLISAYSNNNILLLTRKLLWKYWENSYILENYFLFHIFFTLATERYKEEWEKVPVFNNHSPHTLYFELNNEYSSERWQEIKKISEFHKLNYHLKYREDSNTFYKFILELYNKNN